MSLPSKLLNTILLVGLASSACAVAQQSLLLAGLPEASPTASPVANSEAKPAESVVTKPATPTNPADEPTQLSEKIDRWVDVKELSFSARYRSEKETTGYPFFANAQERSIVDGRLKLDAAARYTLNYHVSSGRTFNWAYSTFINKDVDERDSDPEAFAVDPPALLQKLLAILAAGYPVPSVPSRGWEMSPRQLYLAAAPVSWLTAEYGSLAIERGKSTEITTYDDDGYLTGERLRLHDPKHLFFDEVAVTYAYEGDIFKPNFIDRTQHLKKSNYHQFLLSKNFGIRVGASTDYTFDKKTHTVREAAYIKMPETKALDALRAEFYQRLNAVMVGPYLLSGGSGFGLTAEKTFFHRIKLDGGYEQVDEQYGVTVDDVVAAVFGFSMNGDSYSTGKHVFTHANVKLTPYASLSGFYIHQTQPPSTGEFGFAKEGFNGGLNIDLKKLVNSRQRIF